MSHKVIRIICVLVCFIFAFQNLAVADESTEFISPKKIEIFDNVNISNSISYVEYLKNNNFNLDNIEKKEDIILLDVRRVEEYEIRHLLVQHYLH